MEWDEPLPAQCPPADAAPPADLVLYRLVESNPPSDKDYWSQRKLKPDQKFSNKDECTIKAVSLFDCSNSCSSIRLLPTHKNKSEMVLQITLQPESGVVKKSLSNHHVSWWRAKGYFPDTFKVVA
jgi:hypothetical protein